MYVGAGLGVLVGSEVAVGVGSGEEVGVGEGDGDGGSVAVGSGVPSRLITITGASPVIGGSVVGSVENIPAGGVASELPTESPQDASTSVSNTPAVSIRLVIGMDVFAFTLNSFWPYATETRQYGSTSSDSALDNSTATGQAIR